MSWRYVLTRFDGRIGRQTWWTALAVLALTAVAASFPLSDLTAGAEKSQLWVEIATLGLLGYPLSAIMVKRLHDRARSGRWVALIWAGPIVILFGQVAGLAGTWSDVYGTAVFVPNAAGKMLYGLAALAGLWTAVELGALRGSNGDNRHGPDPLQHNVGT